MTQEEIDARIKELEAERDKKLAETLFERYGPGKTSHGKIRRYYNFKIGNLRKHGVENPLQRPELKKRMIDTRIERYGCGHGNVQKMLETKVEKWGNKSGNVAKVTETKRKLYGNGVGDIEAMKEKKIARYGNAWGPQDKIKATKLERWGNTWGNIEACKQTRIKRWGTAAGNVEAQRATKRAKYGNINNARKATKTKIERYGYVFDMQHTRAMIEERYGGYAQIIAKAQQTKIARYGSLAAIAAKAHKTKLLKYGNTWGPQDKIKATNLERYGVEYTCLSEQCIAARGKCQSNVNAWWHAKLFEHLSIDFATEHSIIRYAYDLRYADKLLIEINPTFTHNATYSFEFATGRSTHNRQLPVTKHYDKTMLAIEHGFDCITIWDWDDVDFAMQCIKAALNGDIDTTKERIDIDLSKEPLLQYLNAGYEIVETYIQKHWFNYKTAVHFIDKNFERQPLIDKGFVEVYDCGHAILQRKQLSNI